VHRPRARRAVAASLALALLVAVGACSSSSREPSRAGARDRTAGAPAPTAGFDGQTIRLGELTDLSGAQRYIGLPVTAGSTAWFNLVNTELGGIGGKYKVQVDVQDTGGVAGTATTAYAAMRSDVALVAQLLGAEVVTALLPPLHADGLIAAPVVAAGDLRDANLLPTGVPVGVQAANGLERYLTHHATPGPVCSVVQQDAWGDTAQAGLAEAAAQHHLTLGPEVRVPPPHETPSGLDGPLGQLRAARCAAAFLFTTPATSTAVLTQASAAQLDLQWVALAGSWTSTLTTSPVIDYLRARVAVVTEGPSWGDGRVEATQEVDRVRVGYSPSSPPDLWFRYGELQAQVVQALLEKAVALGDLSRAGLLAASRALGPVSFRGLAGTFTYGPPADRHPPTTSSISKVDPSDPAGLRVVAKDVRSPAAARIVAGG
jgi:ABC-type branched-subunit amino acid transport system substrate-binding protein